MLANKNYPNPARVTAAWQISTLYSKISSGPNFWTFSPLSLLSSTLRKKPVRKHLCACSSRCRSDSCISGRCLQFSYAARGVTVVNNFDAKRYLGTWYGLPVLITVLNVDWKKSPQHTPEG